MVNSGYAMDNFSEKLSVMSKSDLDDLFNDDEKIKRMVMECATIQNLKAEKKRLMKSNQALATSNLACEPQLKDLKRELIEAHEKFGEVYKDYQRYKSDLDKANANFSPQTLLALLKVANAEEEEKSEELLDRLMAKQIDLDDYLRQVYVLRKSYNLRRIKIEKLSEMENVGGSRRSRDHPPPPPSSNRRHNPYPNL